MNNIKVSIYNRSHSTLRQCRRLNRKCASYRRDIEKLETKLQIAIEALEFYGDTTNWFDVVDFGLLEKARLNDEAGYTRAKDALEKIGGGE